ncbi:MAG: hypothetical protein SPF92_01270 [Clostridia bacterium]|nr:hypothetical protein [Oscillospiraceae bacterium]MDY5626217.1 hypothetical protein [Clostridia bacterium]
MVEDDKMNFYVNGRLEFYVRESGGVSFVPNCFFGTYNSDTFSYTNRLSNIP